MAATQGGHLFLCSLRCLWSWSFFCSAKDEIYINVSEYLHGMRKKSELMNGEQERALLHILWCGYYIIITLNLHVVFIF